VVGRENMAGLSGIPYLRRKYGRRWTGPPEKGNKLLDIKE